MSDLDLARRDPEQLLWQQLGEAHAGMLGLEGSGQHLQPMAHFADKAGRRLWFLTKRDSDLFQSLEESARAHFVIISKAHDFHSCMTGPIHEEANGAFLDEIWNSHAAAWFEGGKDDPDLVMVALDLQHARIWASTKNTLAYAWEIAKANAMEETTPDVGVRAEVNFAG
ncbi:pyridoxamine 5'-phosphate oxidase family protein [soil metagenome]